MANEDDMIRRLVDAIERNARLSSVSGGTSSDLNGTDSLIAKAKQSAAALDKLSMGLKLTTSSQRKYNDALYKNTRVVEQLEEELENLKDAIKKTGDETLKAKKKEVESLIRSTRIEEDSAAAGQAFNGMVNRLAGTIKSFGSQIINSQVAVVSAIQSGASGFGIAGEVMNQQAQLQNTLVQGLASAAQSAASGLMALGPIGVAAGVVINALAAYASVKSELETQQEIARNRLITTEADKMLTAWKGATSAGAVLMGGANQMLNSLAGTVYVLGDYEAAVKRNSKVLAESNIGVGEASMLFGGVAKRLGTFQKGLLAVGIGYETQLDIIAQTAANMTAAQPNLAKQIGREAFEARVAERTKQYATDLARLSTLTGESADALAKKKAADEQEAAFQGFLRDLGDRGPGVLEAFRQMPIQLQKAAFETAQFGGPITSATALFGTLNPVLGRLGEQYGLMARNGTLNIDSMIALGKANSEAVLNERKRQTDLDSIGYIAKGTVGASQNAAEQTLQWLLKLNSGGDKAVRNQIDAAQNKTGDAASNLSAEFANMEEAGRKLRVEIQQKVLAHLGPSFGAFYAALRQASKYIDDILNKNLNFTPFTSQLDNAIKQIETLTDKVKFLGIDLDEWTRVLRLSTIAINENRLANVGAKTPGAEGEGAKPGAPKPPGPGQLPEGYQRAPGQPGMVISPGGIIIREADIPKAPAPAPAPSSGSWFDSIKNWTSEKLGAAKTKFDSALASTGAYLGEMSTRFGKFLDDIPILGKAIKMAGSALETLAKWIGKMAAPLTAFFSGLEATKDISSYFKGEFGGFDLAKKLTSNIVSTVSAFIISGLVAAGVTTATSPTGPAAPVAGVAAGISTFMAVDAFMRWMIDNGFELVRPANIRRPGPRPENLPNPNPNSDSPPPRPEEQGSIVAPSSPVQVGSINTNTAMSPVALKIDNSPSASHMAAMQAQTQKLEMVAAALKDSGRSQKSVEEILASHLEVARLQLDDTATLVGYNNDQLSYLRGINRQGIG